MTLLDFLLGLLFLYITINRYFLQDVWNFSLRYYELIGLAVLYILLRQMPKKAYLWLMLAVVISGIIQAVYGSLQLYGYYSSYHSGFRMTGSFFNPGPYAGFLASVFPVALGIYLFKPLKQSYYHPTNTKYSLLKKRYSVFVKFIFTCIPLSAILTILLILPASQSRAAWVAVGTSTAFLLFLRYKGLEYIQRIVNNLVKKVSVGIFAIVLITAGFWGLYQFKKDSADGRLLIWKVTTDMISEYPWIGVGFDRFKAHYMNYQASYFQGKPETAEGMLAGNNYYAFNDLWQFISENGFFGGICLFGILLLIMKVKGIKENHPLLYATTGLLSVFTFSLFSYPSHILPIKIIAVLFLVVIAAYSNTDFTLKRPLGKPELAIKAFVMAGVLVGIFYLNVQIQKVYQGLYDWKNAFSHYQRGAYRASLENFKKAEVIFHNEGDFLMNYGKALSMADKHIEAVEILRKAQSYLNTTIIHTTLGDSYKVLDEYDNAETAYMQAVYMIPSRFYPQYLLAKLYDISGKEEKALIVAQNLMKKEVKVESIAIEEIKMEMKEIIQRSIIRIKVDGK